MEKITAERREIMRVRSYIVCAMLALAVISASIATLYHTVAQYVVLPQTVAQRANGAGGDDAAPWEVMTQGGYTLREYNGVIAVFTRSFGAEPAIVTDIRVADLREYDRRLLEAGIRAESYEDVLRLFEDFGH
jgi:hypothetical protein